jgi:hypothetical protein
MTPVIGSMMAALWMAATQATPPMPPPGKVPAAVAQEMSAAIVAVNKALGMESWPTHGVAPCVDRGGEGTMAKDVSAAETRRCAEAALATGFPLLGKSYTLAVTMTSFGPSTVIALGMADAVGFGAYSCDPGRKCLPTRIQSSTKWGKRLLERQQKACAETETVWLPAATRVCEP